MRVCESSSPGNQRLSNPGRVHSAKSGRRPTNSTIDPPIQSNPLQLQCHILADVEVQKCATITFIDTFIITLILMVTDAVQHLDLRVK